MKVFGLYPNTGYSGGVILIAANNVEEAKEIAHRDKDMEFYGDIEHIEEVEELLSNVDSPKIILNSWYIECMI